MAHGEALRIRVIKAVVEDGLSRNAAARIFRVGIASAIRWVSAFEETRRTAALPVGGVKTALMTLCDIERIWRPCSAYRWRGGSTAGHPLTGRLAASPKILSARATSPGFPDSVD